MKDTYTNQGNSGAYASSEPWTGGGISTLWGPAGNYTAMNSGNYGGLGYQWLGYSGGAVIRGGSWLSGATSGVFNAYLGHGPSVSSNVFGFRCVWHP